MRGVRAFNGAGVPPTPTALKILRGDPGRKTPGLGVAPGQPTNEPQPTALPASLSGKPPSSLDKAGQAQWKKLVPVLSRMRVLTEADVDFLTNLCSAYSLMEQTQRELRKLGLMMKLRSGGFALNPMFAAHRDQMKLVNEMLREFGMSPAARTRVKIADSNPANDEWEERDRRRDLNRNQNSVS